MAETSSVSGTLNRTTKQSDIPHPHYFSSFQNYCCGPKAKTTSSPSNKDLSPIPEKFKKQTDDILQVVNRFLIERLPELTQYTSILPYEFFEQDRGIDGQRYLVDRTMYKMMTETRVINWMPSLKKLYPVRTSGNGNCLLHAVLIAMAGVHDFNLNLRDRLLQFMDKNKEVLKGSWKTERLKTDKMYGIQSEDSKLDSEWEELCDLVRYENSDDGQTTPNLQFLEAVHIFSISNMLARPIIILSEDVVRNKHGEAISYNDLFGIYLPILSRPQDCVAIPIVLAYDQSHFCPLQANDKDNGTLADNFLPLYQSIEHTQNQTLLPIRFLGNDGGSDQLNKLLQTYLRIKKLSYYPDTNSAPLPIVCAELGGKRFQDKDNYFLLYYDYIVHFFEIQKRKLQEDEEEEKRRREQAYYPSNPPSYDPIQRSIIKTDMSSSSSPPPPYSSSPSTRANDNKNNFTSERRSSYERAVTNGTACVSYNDVIRPISQYSEPQNYSKVTPRAPFIIDKPYTTYQVNSDVINNERMSNGKIINNITANPRGNDSKLRQEKQPQPPVRIPVQFKKSDSPSNLIDFEQKTDKIRPCIVCKHYFNDLLATGLCSECDYNTKHPPPIRYVTTVRAPPLNNYPSIHRTSDFITPLSSSRTKGPQKLLCPHCRNINLLNNTQHGRDYACSICQTILHVPRS